VTGTLEGLKGRIQAEMRGEIPAPYVEFVEVYAHPFHVDVHGVTRAVKKGFFVLSFVGVQLLFAASITAAMLTLDELRTGTLRRLATTPVSPWEFLAGKYLATTVIVVLSVLLGIAYSRVAFGVQYFPSIEGWAFVLLGTVASAAVGVLVALLCREEKSASAVLNAVAFPAMFLGAVVVPENLVPKVASEIFHWYPPVTFVHALRATDLYGKPAAVADVVVGTILTAAVFAASALAFRRAARG
jgi:ABC-2 type transport system permease protein